MRTRTAVRLLAVTALLVLSATFAPAASGRPTCDQATCNQNCIQQGFFGGGCINGRCFCIAVIP
jgi:hypothetical protein